jgi:hypothetical protein
MRRWKNWREVEKLAAKLATRKLLLCRSAPSLAPCWHDGYLYLNPT